MRPPPHDILTCRVPMHSLERVTAQGPLGCGEDVAWNPRHACGDLEGPRLQTLWRHDLVDEAAIVRLAGDAQLPGVDQGVQLVRGHAVPHDFERDARELDADEQLGN